MEKNRHWPLLVFGSADKVVSRRIRQAVTAGALRELAPRIYSTDLHTAPAELLRRQWILVLAYLAPGAVVSHRSALEALPTGPEGHLFATYSYTRTVTIPGLTLHLLTGPGPQPLDRPFGSGKLYFASEARAVLENCQPARARSGPTKVLPRTALEEYLENVLRVRGEEGLNTLRDLARNVASEFGWEPEFAKLQQLIAALLATGPASLLTSPVAQARAFGLPYDPARVDLFNRLFAALRQTPLPIVPDPAPQPPSFYELAFFEAYFSNFIEGTIFEVDEAHGFVMRNEPLATRPADSHDVLGTYQLVSNRAEMERIPASADELLTLLQYRHATLLRGRPDQRPGQWKERSNRAGNTSFVDPPLVRGTLHKGFEVYQALEHPLARAILMMFIISEVHPFDDGNGRVARIMMNAELVRAKQCRIIITTHQRPDYLLALRRLSRQGDPSLYLRMLVRAQAFTADLLPTSYLGLKAQLEAVGAFSEAQDDLRF